MLINQLDMPTVWIKRASYMHFFNRYNIHGVSLEEKENLFQLYRCKAQEMVTESLGNSSTFTRKYWSNCKEASNYFDTNNLPLIIFCSFLCVFNSFVGLYVRVDYWNNLYGDQIKLNAMNENIISLARDWASEPTIEIFEIYQENSGYSIFYIALQNLYAFYHNCKCTLYLIKIRKY